jgi:hypothetical protein
MTEHTDKRGVSILSSARNDRRPIGISNQKVGPGQRFENPSRSLSHQDSTVYVTFPHVIYVHRVQDGSSRR